jgi:hypothetical protein
LYMEWLRRDENVHALSKYSKLLLRLPLVRLQHTHNVVYTTCIITITWDEVGGRVGINHGRKASYFTRHFDGFPAPIPWFHWFHGFTDSKLYHLPFGTGHCRSGLG